MGYEISVDAKHGIAAIRLIGEIEYREHVRACDELLAVCRAQELRKILIDARDLKGSAPPIIDLFDFGLAWAKQLLLQPGMHVAGVPPVDPATREWWRFGETVAGNRGFCAKLFDGADQAFEWLRGI